jgi:hypothetical protein
MKTLADFKRYLATPDASLKMIHLSYNGQERPVFTNEWRTVAKLQTNSVALRTPTNKSGKSWLEFGKASEWLFDEQNKTCQNESNGTRIVYEWL